MHSSFPSRTPWPARVLALALGAGPAGPALASPATDIAALQKQMAAMKADYDHRLAALEQELHATQAALAQAQAQAQAPAGQGGAPAVAAAPTPVPTPPPTSTATSTATAEPAPAADAMAVAPATAGPSPAGGGNAFNPSVSLILSGLYVHTSVDPSQARLTGFALPPDSGLGLGSRGFSLAESELALAANIDPYLAGNINLSISGENTIAAEEAYIATTTLPDGLVLKAGRFFSGLGYLNSQHSHTWDFVDAPLAYQALLGTQYADDGLQLHWLAPIDQYLELGLEAGRGHGFPGDNASRNAPGSLALTLHTGGDVGDSNSWRAGLSVLRDTASDLSLVGTDALGHPVNESFTGHTRTWVADGVWKWAPQGNATRTYFKLQGEFLQSRREGSLLAVAPQAGPYRSVQSGAYLQGVWQFEPRWRVGLRTEWMDPGHADEGPNAGLLAQTSYHPTKNSLMVDFNESEFARIRLQLAMDKSQRGLIDRQVILQYQTSLGAHGAHAY